MSAVARARRPPSPAFLDPPGYARHRPERTLLYQLVEQHYPAFRELRAAADRPLPDFVQQEFEAYLKCGRLEEGFLRVRCEQCHAEKLVAFSCKKRGFCPSCGGRRMAETAALLADEVLPDRPLRQWVLSLPHALRFLLAVNSEALTLVLGEVYRTISRHLIGKAGLSRATGATGAVTLVQRFGSALNLNVHFHMVFLDGAYQTVGAAAPVFRPVAAPESSDLQQLVEQIAGRIGRALERRGLVERDLENAWLAQIRRPVRWMICSATRSPTVSRWGQGQGRSSLRCRRLRLDCRDRKASRTVPPARAGSPCTPVWTLRRMSVRSSNDCAAM